ncbi:GNAT family N-acetyltransferase [Pseudoduganella sp. GCM10020061]|uniref:GNAT family N-acetyltransferase n=1 Tax=Pseudoduganella sp. GCM10020061 TaxID=3317345 RepID=UPI00362FC58A
MICEIRAATPADLPALFAYLGEQLMENGSGGSPLFQPVPRTADPVVPLPIRSRFTNGLATPVGEAGWRRAWLAIAGDGAIAGHIDLRARPEQGCAHRTMLGMAVQRDYRRLGLGLRLIDTAAAWAREAGFAWIDLEVLSGNTPAIALYHRAQFGVAGEIVDMYRIDGESHASTLMTRAL